MVVRDTYLRPRMDEGIESLVDAAVFVTIDWNSRYLRIEIFEAYPDETIFSSKNVLFGLIWMPLELKNAPATSQRAGNTMSSRAKWKFALVYLKDITAHSKSVMDHLKHVGIVLTLLRDAMIELEFSKFSFFENTIFVLVTHDPTEKSSRRQQELLRSPQVPAYDKSNGFVIILGIVQCLAPSRILLRPECSPLNVRLEKTALGV